MIKIHPVQTGTMRVKRSHRAYRGPGILSVPRMVTDPHWTDDLPVYCWLIDHPDGLLMVDTGESARINTAEYMDRNPRAGWFYQRALRFDLTREDEADMGLRALGFEPLDVEAVVLTHMHSDHVGGLTHFPRSRFLVGSLDALECRGALSGSWPRFFRAEEPHTWFEDIGSVGRAAEIASGVFLFPTPGHARGHHSVLIERDDDWVILAGDVTFDVGQLFNGEIGGVTENRRQAADSVRRIMRHAEKHPTIYLAAHDPEAPDLLGAQQLVMPPRT